jgi:alpha-tubulin suppressor-like RCC1 family protein
MMRQDDGGPTKIKALQDVNVKDISAGFPHSLACSHDGRVWSWGSWWQWMFRSWR